MEKHGEFIVNARGFSEWKPRGGAGAPAGGGGGASVTDSQVLPCGDAIDRKDPIPFKPVAPMGYGQRVRVARLWQSHEEFLD